MIPMNFPKTQSRPLAFFLYLLGPFVLFLCAGCQHSDISDFVSVDHVRISWDKALEMADQRAEKILAEDTFNSDTFLRPLGPDGKPLVLADYSRSVSIYTRNDRPTMFIFYKCRKPLDYLGGWTHFGITVLLDTGEITYTGGR